MLPLLPKIVGQLPSTGREMEILTGRPIRIRRQAPRQSSLLVRHIVGQAVAFNEAKDQVARFRRRAREEKWEPQEFRRRFRIWGAARRRQRASCRMLLSRKRSATKIGGQVADIVPFCVQREPASCIVKSVEKKSKKEKAKKKLKKAKKMLKAAKKLHKEARKKQKLLKAMASTIEVLGSSSEED